MAAFPTSVSDVVSSDQLVVRAAASAFLGRYRGQTRLCHVQIAAHHADPKTTMRYDRARKNLDRHPNYILAAYMASGT
jgi:hypothetical protein